MLNMKNKSIYPKSFYLLFSIEMWERFGFLGMQAILVLYLVKYLSFSDTLADNTFSAFAALVYAFVSLGGWIGDKVLGNKRTLFLGAIVLSLGYLLLGINCEKFLYIGLGTIIAGNALFKSNPGTLVSKLFKRDDHRIDSVFTVYYMAINIGGFLSMIITPIIQKKFGWNMAFLISFFGLLIAISNYIFFNKLFSKIGSEPDFKPLNYKKLFIVILFTIAIILLSTWLLQNLTIARIILYIAIFVVIVIFIKEILSLKIKEERVKLIICSILILEAIIFFILYQQMPTSLNLFAQRNTIHSVFGISIDTATFQALNPMWIIILSPILAYLYTKLGEKKRDMSLPGKFAFGMVLCSFGFLSLFFAAKFFADKNGMISGNWLILSYGLQSAGELLVSGLGLSMVAKLAPPKTMGFMMGAFFMSTSISMILGGFVADLASIPKTITDPVVSLGIYSDLFLKIGLISLLISIIMIIFVPKLKKYI